MSTKYQVAIERRKHAKLRARQRYGLVLNRADIESAIAQIQQGAQKIRSSPDKAGVYLVQIRGEQLYAAYSKRRQCILTFLPVQNFRKER